MPPTREQLKHATQQRVVDTAGRLFRERGFAETTVRDIAEASGVSAGTVMAVGDKNALLVSVFDSMVAAEHGQRAVSEVVESTDTGRGTCSGRLLALVTPFVTLFTNSPVLARSYASILVSGTHESLLFTGLAARLNEEFRAAITVHGCTAQADTPVVAGALYFAYIGTLFTWSARGSSDPEELLSSLQATFTTICTCKE